MTDTTLDNLFGVIVVESHFIRPRKPWLISTENSNSLGGVKASNYHCSVRDLPSNDPESLKKCVVEHSCEPVSIEHGLPIDGSQFMIFKILELPSDEYQVGVNRMYIVHHPTKQYLAHTACREENVHTRECGLADKLELDIDCLVIGHHWADGFQHGTQDIFPKLVACKQFLDSHPNLHVILPLNEDVIWWMKQTQFRLQNPITMTNKYYVSTTGKLYTTTIYPGQKCEFVPWPLITNMYQPKSGENKYLVYLTRQGCDARVPNNYPDIERVMMDFASLKGVEFVCVDPGTMSRNKLIDIMVNSLGVVAPHGGANYNVLFMRRSDIMDRKRFFIELIVEHGTHHTYHIALAARVNYSAIVVDGANHYTKDMNVDVGALQKTLCVFE